MNFLSRMPNSDVSLPLAPMIDIIFLLLIFFITTSVFARMEHELSVTVPAAESAATPTRAMGELIINVQEDGGIIVNQRRLTREQLRTILTSLAERFPDQAVIIRPDRRLETEGLYSILDICVLSGIWNFKFAALAPEDAAE